jgi:hypothetical protein
MGNMTRRTFIRGTAAIAAGAAAGLTIPKIGQADSKGIREYAPVKVWTRFLGPESIVIQGAIYADDRRDVFGIRVFDKGEEFSRAELPFSVVKDVMASPKRITCRVSARNEHGKIERFIVNMFAHNGNLVLLILEQNHSSTPVWMSLADVQRVL